MIKNIVSSNEEIAAFVNKGHSMWCAPWFESIGGFKKGMVVKHNGVSTNKRRGWCGVIIDIYDDYVSVKWSIDSGGEVFLEKSSVFQDYSSWALTNLLILVSNGAMYMSKLVPILTVIDTKDAIQGTNTIRSSHAPEEGVLSYDGSFLIWTPISGSNPRVIHDNIKKAEEEALRLTIKYNKEFFVARLVAKTTIERTATVSIL